MLKTLLPALLLFALLSSSTFWTPPSAEPSSEKIIQKMITAYGNWDHGPKQIEQYLTQLKELDPEQGERWQEIMDYWAAANAEFPTQFDTLPEGLPEDNSLCIVVLGFQLLGNSNMQPELLNRLEAARNCAEQYPNAYILCTGGGTSSPKYQATEAGKMSEWLEEQGIDPIRILVEDQSLSTAENAQLSHILLAEHPEIKALAIVTSTYHVPWAASLFQAQAILLGDSAPRVIAHAASPSTITRDFLANQVDHMRILAKQNAQEGK